MTGKSIRFLGRSYLPYAVMTPGFGLLIALGLWVTRNPENLFGNYYRMFPMLVIIFVGVSAVTQGGAINIALGMNAGRRGLYWANQVIQVGVILLAVAVTALLWQFGDWIGMRDARLPSLWVLLPLGACCLAISEGGTVVSCLGTGTLGKVLLIAYGVLVGIAGLSIVLLLFLANDTGTNNIGVNCIVATAALMLAAALAGMEFRLMRKAVVRI